MLDEVVKRGIPYILTRGSRPEAALVPYNEFLRYQEFQEREILSRFDRLVERMASQNERFSEEEVEVDLQAAQEQALSL